MKTRNGFVSNSSSSSFIVALKKCPENAEELREMFFGKLDPTRMIYPDWDSDYEYGWSVRDLSEQMFKDLVRRNPKSMIHEEIAEMMEGLYYYDNSHNGFTLTPLGGLRSTHGWVFREDSRFFGCDEELLHQLQILEVQEEHMRNQHSELENMYITLALTKKGINPVPRSEPEYEEYWKKKSEYLGKAYKEDKGYKKLRDKHIKESQDHYQKTKEKRREVALRDAQWMMDCHKDHFIAHFEYGDNHGDSVPTGMGTVLENGHEVWNRVSPVKINHH